MILSLGMIAVAQVIAAEIAHEQQSGLVEFLFASGGSSCSENLRQKKKCLSHAGFSGRLRLKY